MKPIWILKALLTVSISSSLAHAAPSVRIPSTDEIVKTVLSRPVVLQGMNSKGSLGADTFALNIANGQVMRANLRSNSASPSNSAAGDTSMKPEAFHVSMNLTTPAGATQTIRLRFSGRTKESPAHTRILTYEAPLRSAYAGSGKLVAIVGQTRSPERTWTTNSTYVRFLGN